MKLVFFLTTLLSLCIQGTAFAGVTGKAAGPRPGLDSIQLYKSKALGSAEKAQTIDAGEFYVIIKSGGCHLSDCEEDTGWLLLDLGDNKYGYAKRTESEVLSDAAIRCVQRFKKNNDKDERNECLRQARRAEDRLCYRDQWIANVQNRETKISKGALPFDPDAGRNWCIPETGIRMFTPKVRIYFDLGKDEKDEIDVFRDGQAAISVDLAEFRFNWPVPSWGPDLTHRLDDKGETIEVPSIRSAFSIGTAASVGIGTPAQDSREVDEDSGDPVREASNAPVLMANVGFYAEAILPGFDRKRFVQSQQEQYASSLGVQITVPKIILEIGWAQAWSTDENFKNADDGALFVGVGITLPFGG